MVPVYETLVLGAQIEQGGNIVASGELDVALCFLLNAADFLR